MSLLPSQAGNSRSMLLLVRSISLFVLTLIVDSGLLTSVYYGRLADIKGRRHVLLLSTCGILLMYAWIVLICQSGVKVELAWLSSVFLLLGGGLRVFNAMIVAAVSDSLSDSSR